MPLLDFAPSGAYTIPGSGAAIRPSDEVLLQRTIAIKRLKARMQPRLSADMLIAPPPNNVPFLYQGTRAVSAMTANTVSNLIDERVPGMEGVITDFACWFSGSGFVEGGGVLKWKLVLGFGYAYTRGNISYTIGPDFGTSLVGQGGILIQPDQLVRVQLVTGSAGQIATLDPQGQTIVRVKGWFLPND